MFSASRRFSIISFVYKFLNAQRSRVNGGRCYQGSRRLFFDRCLFAFAGGLFSFQKHGVPDDHVQTSAIRFERDDDEDKKQGWELLYEDKAKDLRVFRRLVKDFAYEVYEYRIAGTFHDISLRHYIDAQNDVEYRSEWDSNVLRLEIIQDDGNQQLIRWVTKYPFPMYPREYVYVRRTSVSEDRKIVVIESEAVPEEIIPSSSRKNVRVSTYNSHCAVRAHSDVDSHGVDYVLTYFDNPEANIPTSVYNWIVNQGGPYFVNQVHVAAKQLEKSKREVDSIFADKPKQKCVCNHACPVHCPSAESEKGGVPEDLEAMLSDLSDTSEEVEKSPIAALVSKMVPATEKQEKPRTTESEPKTSTPADELFEPDAVEPLPKKPPPPPAHEPNAEIFAHIE